MANSPQAPVLDLEVLGLENEQEYRVYLKQASMEELLALLVPPDLLPAAIARFGQFYDQGEVRNDLCDAAWNLANDYDGRPGTQMAMKDKADLMSDKLAELQKIYGSRLEAMPPEVRFTYMQSAIKRRFFEEWEEPTFAQQILRVAQLPESFIDAFPDLNIAQMHHFAEIADRLNGKVPDEAVLEALTILERKCPNLDIDAAAIIIEHNPDHLFTVTEALRVQKESGPDGGGRNRLELLQDALQHAMNPEIESFRPGQNGCSSSLGTWLPGNENGLPSLKEICQLPAMRVWRLLEVAEDTNTPLSRRENPLIGSKIVAQMAKQIQANRQKEAGMSSPLP